MLNQHFSILSIILLLITSVAIVLLFSFLKSYILLFLSNSKRKSSKIRNWFYLSEAIIIISVLSIFISYSFSRNLILAIVLILLLLIIFYYLSIFFLKDYLAGLLIKTSGDYRINDHISVEKITGQITNFGKTQMEIKSSNGNTVYLPYGLLISKIKSLQAQTEKIYGYSFDFQMKKINHYHKDIELLQEYIRTLPWTHPSYRPEILLKEENQTEYKLQITIFAFDKKYYQKIKNAISQKYNTLE